MGIFEKLEKDLTKLENENQHDGYWYSTTDALLVLVCGMLCGLSNIDDIHDWAKSNPSKKFFEKEFKMKKLFCRAQFYNLLGCVDPEAFKHIFIGWMSYVLGSGLEGKTVSIDGKTICSTDSLTKDGSVLHIASALVSEFNLVIGNQECATKTDEINAFRELVGMLDVSGSVVVADALHCKPKSAKAVIDAEADYLFVVKDNQEELKEDIELYFQTEESESYQTQEKNGGRIETRTGYVSHDINWLDQKEKWIDLECIGAIHREFEKNGIKSSEWHYYISSCPLSAKELLKRARMEWAVESMHWLLDVHFDEDRTRVFDMNVQKILNTTRKISLNMVRIFRDNFRTKRTPLTSVFKENLFDHEQLVAFLDFFRNFESLQHIRESVLEN